MSRFKQGDRIVKARIDGENTVVSVGTRGVVERVETFLVSVRWDRVGTDFFSYNLETESVMFDLDQQDDWIDELIVKL